MKEKCYIAIDLKSFYASVECVDRGLDAMTTHLVVADESRTEKTICLAVSPSLRALGVPGRARLFEVVQRVKEINAERKRKAPGGVFTGKSFHAGELSANPSLELSYVVAVPRMAHYMEISSGIYEIYLKYIAPEDMHVYSIDEVFMDVTGYLRTYGKRPEELARMMIREVLGETGITATAGIGTNLYLCKIAMDIVAKHMPADENGVRIAQLDERRYRELLWTHEPITDFWRVGPGISKKLAEHGIYTMGDIARCSLGRENQYYKEELLYRLFGINAELLIDHAWGIEPCTMKEIKAYQPENTSVGSAQVMSEPTTFERARLLLREMADSLSLQLMEKKLVTDQLVIAVSFDRENLAAGTYRGEVKSDRYGRSVPKSATGTIHLDRPTSLSGEITEGALKLFTEKTDPALLIRRLGLAAVHVLEERVAKEQEEHRQLDLFADFGVGKEKSDEKKNEKTDAAKHKEKKMQEAMLNIQNRFGKNAMLKGTDLEEGANLIERNKMIGGHKA